MSDREQYTPGPAHGAQVKKGGEKWTLILVRELRHSPERVWRALADTAHLPEWAPFTVDSSLGTVGTVKLTWVGTPTPIETRVTRADARKVLQCSDTRWELEASAGGTLPDAVAEHRSPLHRVGRCGLARCFRYSGSAARRSAHWTYRRGRRHEVRRLAAAERGVHQPVRY